MESEDTVPLLISRKDQGKTKIAHFIHSDKTVGGLGDFPELTKAVREGRSGTVSILCAQLFILNSLPNVLPAFRLRRLVGLPSPRRTAGSCGAGRSFQCAASRAVFAATKR